MPYSEIGWGGARWVSAIFGRITYVLIMLIILLDDQHEYTKVWGIDQKIIHSHWK